MRKVVSFSDHFHLFIYCTAYFLKKKKNLVDVSHLFFLSNEKRIFKGSLMSNYSTTELKMSTMDEENESQ